MSHRRKRVSEEELDEEVKAGKRWPVTKHLKSCGCTRCQIVVMAIREHQLHNAQMAMTEVLKEHDKRLGEIEKKLGTKEEGQHDKNTEEGRGSGERNPDEVRQQ